MRRPRAVQRDVLHEVFNVVQYGGHTRRFRLRDHLVTECMAQSNYRHHTQLMPTLGERLTRSLGDRYAIERQVGEGGMATVFLARDIRHDRRVAIKVLREDVTQRMGVERFLREIRTTATLSHPHIVPLLDSGESDGIAYYVMPLVAAESLRGRSIVC